MPNSLTTITRKACRSQVGACDINTVPDSSFVLSILIVFKR